MNTRTAILAAALGALTLTTPALAKSSEQAGIQYTDLDLTTKAGQAKLDRRIDSAAKSACGMDRVVTGRVTPSTEARACYERAKATAHEQVAAAVARARVSG